MLADFGRHMPQEFTHKEQCLDWLKDKQLGIKRSITLLDKQADWMQIRVPITNEIVEIHGEVDEIRWLHLAMVRNAMYIMK
jgi:hypothetical protein